MFEKLKESRVMRDPIHGYIHVDLQIIKDLIDSFEFQRLRRIHQLGGTYLVYHGAEHSRFSHSLGVYEIVRRIVSEGLDFKNELSEYDQVSVMIAALLHDVGHGPFSHAFEAIAHTSHEDYTIKIITGSSQINTILCQVDEKLPSAVASIIGHTHPNRLLIQLVSSQLDADRMDYLLRDSYYTGTSYGQFDLERVLRSLRIQDNRIVVKLSGIHTIEDYIMSRYHMYWQVYYHPTSRSYESIIARLFARLHELWETDEEIRSQYSLFAPFMSDTLPSVEDYIMMDEPAALYGISLMYQRNSDPILKDLARRILERDLFDVEEYNYEELVDYRKQQIHEAGFNTDYYFICDETRQVPYLPYASKETDPIMVLTEDGKMEELSVVSNIVAAIVAGKVKDDKRLYYPKHIVSQTQKQKMRNPQVAFDIPTE